MNNQNLSPRATGVTLLLCFSKGPSLTESVTRSPIEPSAGQLKMTTITYDLYTFLKFIRYHTIDKQVGSTTPMALSTGVASTTFSTRL